MSEHKPFTRGKIEDVLIKPLPKFIDERGWLSELWRTDNVSEQVRPVMTYVSKTYPGVVRGPHEHVDQTDYFCFIGPGNFKLYLWDNRPDSPTFWTKQVVVMGEDAPHAVIIPPGVVHAYKNTSPHSGIVINCPNALYRGEHYKDEIDEIRHEDDEDSAFQVD